MRVGMIVLALLISLPAKADANRETAVERMAEMAAYISKCVFLPLTKNEISQITLRAAQAGVTVQGSPEIGDRSAEIAAEYGDYISNACQERLPGLLAPY